MKIGDRVFIHGYVDEIRKDTIIIRNKGGYFGTVRSEVITGLPSAQPEIIRCKDCEHWDTTWQNDFAPNYHYCPLIDGTRRDDFYCADAERRGEQDE